MTRLARSISGFLSDEQGATAIEYGLITVLIAVGAILAFTALGTGLENLYGANGSGIGTKLDSATGQI
jgi:pilus assembly protein Flp/PilA